VTCGNLITTGVDAPDVPTRRVDARPALPGEGVDAPPGLRPVLTHRAADPVTLPADPVKDAGSDQGRWSAVTTRRLMGRKAFERPAAAFGCYRSGYRTAAYWQLARV